MNTKLANTPFLMDNEEITENNQEWEEQCNKLFIGPETLENKANIHQVSEQLLRAQAIGSPVIKDVAEICLAAIDETKELGKGMMDRDHFLENIGMRMLWRVARELGNKEQNKKRKAAGLPSVKSLV